MVVRRIALHEIQELVMAVCNNRNFQLWRCSRGNLRHRVSLPLVALPGGGVPAVDRPMISNRRLHGVRPWVLAERYTTDPKVLVGLRLGNECNPTTVAHGDRYPL